MRELIDETEQETYNERKEFSQPEIKPAEKGVQQKFAGNWAAAMRGASAPGSPILASFQAQKVIATSTALIAPGVPKPPPTLGFSF